jgi:hypothetical protein
LQPFGITFDNAGKSINGKPPFPSLPLSPHPFPPHLRPATAPSPSTRAHGWRGPVFHPPIASSSESAPSRIRPGGRGCASVPPGPSFPCVAHPFSYTDSPPRFHTPQAAPAGAVTFDELQGLTYLQVKGSGIANTCPVVSFEGPVLVEAGPARPKKNRSGALSPASAGELGCRPLHSPSNRRLLHAPPPPHSYAD